MKTIRQIIREEMCVGPLSTFVVRLDTRLQKLFDDQQNDCFNCKTYKRRVEEVDTSFREFRLWQTMTLDGIKRIIYDSLEYIRNGKWR